ncbi:MAG: GNAT family N-acetyltransferase [Pyrinomonadaceae bacterium]
MESDVEIRIALPDESDAITTLIRDAFAQFESCYTPEAFAATTPDSDKIRKRFDEGEIWSALKNETIVGTVSTVADSEKLYVRSMAVSPSAQGLGIGRRLLKAVENFAIENGFESLFLYTTVYSSSAIRLYEQNGFVRGEDSSPDEFFGTPGFAMEKKLS